MTQWLQVSHYLSQGVSVGLKDGIGPNKAVAPFGTRILARSDERLLAPISERYEIQKI